MRSIFCSSAFSNSRSPDNVWADSPTLPFHCSSFEYSRCSQAKSSCHLLTSANRYVRSHLSVSGTSARIGISMPHSRTELTKDAKAPKLGGMIDVPFVRDVQLQDGARLI